MATRTIVRRDGRRIVYTIPSHIFYELAHLFLGQFWIQLEHFDEIFLLVETTLSPVNLEVAILVDEDFGSWLNSLFNLLNLLLHSGTTLGERDARSLWWAGLLCGFLFENSLGATNGTRGFDLRLGRGLWFGGRDRLFGRRDLSKNANFLLWLKKWVVQDVVKSGQTPM